MDKAIVLKTDNTNILVSVALLSVAIIGGFIEVVFDDYYIIRESIILSSWVLAFVATYRLISEWPKRSGFIKFIVGFFIFLGTMFFLLGLSSTIFFIIGVFLILSGNF